MGQGQGQGQRCAGEDMRRRRTRARAAQQDRTRVPHQEGQEGQQRTGKMSVNGGSDYAGAAWLASPVATGCQGNPCSTCIRWGVSPAVQTSCLHDMGWSPPGADQPAGKGGDKGTLHQHQQPTPGRPCPLHPTEGPSQPTQCAPSALVHTLGNNAAFNIKSGTHTGIRPWSPGAVVQRWARHPQKP